MKFSLNTFVADTRGGVIIYVALAMPVLVGGMGLGGEAGYRYYNQRLLQHAADFAAYTGAVRKFEGDAKAEIDAAALAVAVGSEYDNSVGTITVNVPPVSGTFTGDDTAVEVILTETRPRLFSAIFSKQDVVVAARAVAAVSGTAYSGCILALNETAGGAVTITGDNKSVFSGCTVASNSSADDAFSLSGNAQLTTDCVSTVGSGDVLKEENLDTVECDGVETKRPPVQDPYFWIMEPDTSVIPCQTAYPGKNTQVGSPSKSTSVPEESSHAFPWKHPSPPPDGTPMDVMRFCNGLDVKGDVTFAPGLYIIENGNFTVSGTSTPSISGDGVTFYFTNGGAAALGASAQLSLSAPDDGAYAGILFFGGRDDDEAHQITGNSASTLTGAIYMPASEVTFIGNSDGSNGCTQVIADTINLTGTSNLAIDCSDDGTEEILIGHLIAVVE